MRPLLVDQFNRPVLRASGGYEGAMMQRRLKAFIPSRQSINSLLSHAGDNLVARSHYVVRNNPYARNAKRSFKANLVGMGIKPYSQVQDRELRQDIHTLWTRWLNEADADGITSFYGLQTMIAAALWESGECFVRIRPRRISDGLSVPMQLQLVESEQLPVSKNELARKGNEIRSGIEFDRIGQRVAYHFLRQHPGDNLIRQQPREFTRVPADEVLHIYEAQRPGQIRGEPQTAASLVRMFLLDQYDDAELDRKKVAALFAAFITSPAPDMPALPGQEATAEDGVVIAGLEPGIIQRLDAGEDIRFSEPSEVGGSYEPFEYRNLLAIAAGMGVPYQNVSSDFSRANYSSLRAALLEFRAWMQQLQHCTLIFQFCRPVWRRWMTDRRYRNGQRQGGCPEAGPRAAGPAAASSAEFSPA